MVGSEGSLDEGDWKAEGLRVTTFHDVGVIAKGVEQLWEAITREKPEQLTSRPREGLTVAEGPYGGNTLQCIYRADRVDWNLQPVTPPPNIPIEGFMSMGLFPGVLPSFLDVARKWLEESPPVTRLAFGSLLLIETEDLPDAYRRLGALLPAVRLDADGSSDFFYQINRRRISASDPRILVNRLSKWSVMQGGAVALAVVGNAVPQLSRSPDYFACRLELDINSAGPLSSSMPEAGVTQLFEEFVSLGKEIAQKGDIP